MERRILKSTKLAEAQAERAAVVCVAGNELRLAGLDGFDWESGAALAGAAGRGVVRRVDTDLGAAVVRHYRRGGLLAKIMGDRYFYTGAANTRSFKEFEVLRRLTELGLPVCRPLAARFVRSGSCWYRADLASALIPAARSLHQILLEQGLQSSIAAAVGGLVARFHNVGLWHADLNAHNVLCDAQGRYWLIDFDRSRIRPISPGWRRSNVQRLLRSLHKLGHLQRPITAVQSSFVTDLQSAYAAELAHSTEGSA
jgi:3-deoxy-D-manno-octulosonic acid kinase